MIIYYSNYLDKKDLAAKFEEEISEGNNHTKIFMNNYSRIKKEIQEYEDQTLKWISVKNRLPKGYYPCLVVDADGDYGVGYYREDAKAWDSPNFGWLEMKDKIDNKEAYTEPCRLGKIVAWMPVPKYYKEENNG